MCEHEHLAVQAEFQRYADPDSPTDDLIAVALVVGARCDDCHEQLPVIGSRPVEDLPGYILLALETPGSAAFKQVVLPPGARVQ